MSDLDTLVEAVCSQVIGPEVGAWPGGVSYSPGTEKQSQSACVLGGWEQVGADGWTCPARTGVTTVVLVLPGSQGAKERQMPDRLCFPELFSKCLLAFVPMGSAVLPFAFMEEHVTQVTGTGSGVTQTQVHVLPWYRRSCENVQMLNLSKPPSPHLPSGAKTSQVCRED